MKKRFFGSWCYQVVTVSGRHLRLGGRGGCGFAVFVSKFQRHAGNRYDAQKVVELEPPPAKITERNYDEQ
jgi:hypothetical protein